MNDESMFILLLVGTFLAGVVIGNLRSSNATMDARCDVSCGSRDEASYDERSHVCSCGDGSAYVLRTTSERILPPRAVQEGSR